MPSELLTRLEPSVSGLVDLTLDEWQVGVGSDAVQFHRLKGASGYVALLYFDDLHPAARYPAWYFSWLCVRICADAKANELHPPALIFLAPDDGLLQGWWREAEQCRRVGMAEGISITAVGAHRQWTSNDWIKKCVREWTAPLRAGQDRPALPDDRSRFERGRLSRPPEREQRPYVAIRRSYVFLASPNDLQAERERVRRYFDRFNRTTAAAQGLEFVVLDWEHYSHAGQGDPQTLIFKQVLDRHQQALVLFVGILGSRFGQPTQSHGSGTEAEFEWALEANKRNGWPEIMMFFKLQPIPEDPPLEEAQQFSKVRAFRDKVEKARLLAKTFRDETYPDVVENDLMMWLSEQLQRSVSPVEWSEQEPVR